MLIGDIVGVPVGDLFMGAVLPGMVLVGLFILYVLLIAILKPKYAPAIPRAELAAISTKQMTVRVMKALVPAPGADALVLGSIFAGIASPTRPPPSGPSVPPG